MLFNIWVDDMRQPPNLDNLIWFKNGEDAIKWFENREELLYGDYIHIYLDNDMGIGHKEGYDVAKYIIEQGFCGDAILNPQYLKFHILSANPVAQKNIREIFTHYGFREF